MPPLKVYIQVALIALAGLLLAAGLIFRLVRSLRAGRAGAAFFNGLVLLLFAVLSLGVCAALIPCFNWPLASLCESGDKRIALTFDDGPNEPYTSQLLDVLEQRRVPAAFFTLGDNVAKHPEVVARMLRAGFTVGNHTADHRPLVTMGPADIAAELEGWERVMAPLGLPHLKLFRAPHGWKSPFLKKILSDKGYRLIGWTRGVWDTDLPGEEVLFDRITRRPGPGMILLLHDGVAGRPGADRSELVRVLPRIIDHYRSLGYRFVSLHELLNAQSPAAGVPLAPHEE